MNIATLGVKIDPSGAESGSRAAVKATEKLREALKAVATAAGEADKALSKASDKGAFNKITNAAAAAARAVQSTFSGMVRAVTGSVAGITKALGSIGLALDGLRMITAPFRGFLSDVVGNAADMETFRNQWAFILGSFDKAREKMKTLQDFANKTPFDLPGVTKASLMMADLTHEALKGEAGLKRVGDAAARANQPIEELASRVVRLTGNLQRGAGGGDELRALTEWRIIRPLAAARISDLSTDADNFKEAMEIVVGELNRSEDAMKLMSVTWKGLTSTMNDSWGALKTAIGEPLLEGLKPMIVEITKLVDGMTANVKQWAPEIKAFGTEVSAAFAVLTGPDGFNLTLRAAADYFIEQLKRGFIILGKMLMNIFEVVGYQFTQVLKKLASKEFWVGVGEALVEGIAKAFKFMADWDAKNAGGAVRDAGIVLDDLSQSLGFHRIFGTSQSNYGKAIGEENTPGAPAPLPQEQGPTFRMPWEFESEVPFEMTPDMERWKARQEEERTRAMTTQQYLEYQAREAIERDQGGPQSLLFPSGGQMSGPSGVGELAKSIADAAREHKELTEEAEKWTETTRTNEEQLQRTLERLEKMKAKGLITDEVYLRSVMDAYNSYGEAAEEAGEKAAKAMEKSSQGAQNLIRHLERTRLTLEEFGEQISDSLVNNVSQAFTDLITGAKSAKEAFSDMAASMVRDILNMTMKIIVQYAYMKLLGWVTGTPTMGFGAFLQKSMPVGVMHDGGTAGAPSATRTVAASYFTGAVKYHTGGNVGRNETPAILENGETVLTRDQAAMIKRRLGKAEASAPAGGNVTIINLTDPNAAQNELSRNPEAILNIMAPQMPRIREMVHKRNR